MARTAVDTALMLDVLAGRDDHDPFSVPRSNVEYVDAIDRPTDELSVAYSPDLGL